MGISNKDVTLYEMYLPRDGRVVTVGGKRKQVLGQVGLGSDSGQRLSESERDCAGLGIGRRPVLERPLPPLPLVAVPLGPPTSGEHLHGNRVRVGLREWCQGRAA